MLLGQWKTYFYHVKALHGVKVTVWPAISSTEVIGLFFFEDENGETQRVNSVHYLDIKKKNVIIDQKDVIKSKIFEFVMSFFKQIHCVKIIIKISWVKIYVIHVYINKNAYIVLFDKFSQKLFKVKTVSISMWQPEY